ncbi:MAG: Rieske 2Fe-2S domain-containing protein [Candidatus Binataceae bacterium]
MNSCPHRGATLGRARAGNRKVLTCPDHGWCFNS